MTCLFEFTITQSKWAGTTNKGNRNNVCGHCSSGLKTEAATGGFLEQKVFLETLQDITYAEFQVFPVNFAKFLRTNILQNTSWQLLLSKSQND